MDYDNFTNSKKLDWFDTGPWHNKNICSKLYGTNFEGFIIQARIDRYNIMCSLVAHNSVQDNKKDDESRIGNRVIPNDATVKALKSLGATFNFIDIWIHNFRDNILIKMSLIQLQWSRCSKRYLKMLKCHQLQEKKLKIDDRYWGWMVFGKMCKGTTTVK